MNRKRMMLQWMAILAMMGGVTACREGMGVSPDPAAPALVAQRGTAPAAPPRVVVHEESYRRFLASLPPEAQAGVDSLLRQSGRVLELNGLNEEQAGFWRAAVGDGEGRAPEGTPAEEARARAKGDRRAEPFRLRLESGATTPYIKASTTPGEVDEIRLPATATAAQLSGAIRSLLDLRELRAAYGAHPPRELVSQRVRRERGSLPGPWQELVEQYLASARQRPNGTVVRLPN